MDTTTQQTTTQHTTTQPTTDHVLVESSDDTQIAVFVSGSGRPLVLVPGTTSDHTTWRLVVPLLEPHVEVHAVDRRGRGASGDGPTYALEREFDDLAAVIDAASTQWGGPVDVLGHSYGGNIAFGAALQTHDIRRLVLYEGWPVPDVADRTMAPDLLAHLDDLIARERPAEALELFYREMLQLSDEEIASLAASPVWPARVAAAPTVPRELRAFAAQAFEPRAAARIGVPVLLLVGSESTDEISADPDVVAAALPNASIRMLDGQAHMAHLTAPEMLAEVVLEFLRD